MKLKYTILLIILTIIANVTQFLMINCLHDILNTSAYKKKVDVPINANNPEMGIYKLNCYVKFKDIYDKIINNIKTKHKIKKINSYVFKVTPYFIVKIILCFLNLLIIRNYVKISQYFKVKSTIIIISIILFILSIMSYIYYIYIISIKNEIIDNLDSSYNMFKKRFEQIIILGLTSSTFILLIIIFNIVFIFNLYFK